MDEPEQAVQEYDEIIRLEPEYLPARQRRQAALRQGETGMGSGVS